MSRFDVIDESTEDTLCSAENLSDAICAAKEAARQGRVGNLVSILESGGQAIRQFVLLRDGTIAEQAISRRVNPLWAEPGLIGADTIEKGSG